MSVTAVIIARGGSKRLPDKNMKLFHGLPLVVHKVMQLKRCLHVDQIVVGSDSQSILEAAHRAGAEVRHRADEYCDEISRSWNEVIVDMALRVPGDTILWAHCTNPCIKPTTYDQAVRTYKNGLATKALDSLVSVTSVLGHAWHRGVNGGMYPVNYDPKVEPHPVAASLEPIYFQNGGIFIYDRLSMIRDRYVFGANPWLMTIPASEAVDIDTEADFLRATLAWSFVDT